MKTAFILVVALIACVLWASDAHAQAAAVARVPDQVLTQVTGVTAGWIPVMQGYARNSYNSLVLISLAYRCAMLVLRQAVLEEIVAELVSIILFVGFGLFIVNNGPALFKTVIDSFRQAGSVAGVGISPSDIVTAGIEIASDALSNLSFWSPEASAGLIVIAIVIAGAIAWTAGYMTIALLKSIIILPIIAFSSLFLGSAWTKDIAIRLFMQSIAVGLQVMTTQIMAGGFLTLLRNMVGVLKTFNGTNAIATVIAAVIMALCITVIPEWISSVVGGSSIGESAMLGRAARTTAAIAGGGAIAGVGAGVAGVAAGRLAATQLAAATAGGTAPSSGMGRAMAVAGGTARNIGGAIAQDIGLRMSGQGGRHGSAPWRMAAAMGQEQRLRNEDLNKPGP